MKKIKNPKITSIRLKLLFSYSAVFIIVGVFGSILLHALIKTTIQENLEHQLQNSTATILNMVDTSIKSSIKNFLYGLSQQNLNMIRHFHEEFKQGRLTVKEAKKRVTDIMLKQQIGKTGYLFVWDISRAPIAIPLAVHPKIQGQDVASVSFVQIGAELKEGYMEYEWKNPGEKAARKKSMYLSYFEPWQWVIAASSYREEFYDLINLEDLRKNILSVRFGKTGYPFILDSSGNIVIHPMLEGMNFYNDEDETRRSVLQKICYLKNGKLSYFWKNPGETLAREKLVIFNYLPEFDWIVASSSYLEEFNHPLDKIEKIFVGLSISCILLLITISFLLSAYFTRPIKRLINSFEKGASGDFTVRTHIDSYDEIGKLGHYFNAFMNTFERHAGKLEESEAKYRGIFENSSEGVFRITPDGRFLSANPSLVKMLGFHSSGELFDHFNDIGNQYYLNTEDKDAFKQIIETQGGTNAFEVQLLKRDGSPIWANIKARAVKNEKGVVRYFDGFLEDITERKQVEKELKESEKRYRTILNEMLEGYHEVDLAGNFTFFNEAFPNLFGYSKGEMMGTNFSRYAAEEALSKKLYSTYNEMFKTGLPVQNSEWDIIRKDGRRVTLEFYASIVRDSKGIPIGFRGIVRDITDRKRTEKALQESEAKFRSIFENKGTAIGVYGEDSIIRECNAVFEELSGYSKFEIIGKKKWSDFVVNEDLEKMKAYHAQRLTNEESPPSQYECGIIHRSGEVRTVIININLVGSDRIVSLIDISARKLAEEEQKKLQAQLIQSQKMESLGTIAGGIAHDFNNILSGIFGYSQLAQAHIKNPEKANHHIDQILKGAKRAAELVQQILTFSRQTDYQKKSFRIYQQVSEALKLLRSTLPSTIEIIKKLDSRSIVIADPGKIHQVIMNLCTNAYHAMRKTGGQLTVSLTDVEISEPKQLKNKKILPGNYLELEVSDTGHGMDEKTIEKAFDPYYTTKEMGEGTGLGLAIVQAIVDEHDGYLEVLSTPGRGTNFCIYFPIAMENVETSEANPKIPPSLKGNEKVMFVDDEEPIRQIAKEILGKLGYKISLFNNGTDALKEFEKLSDQFDLIITDMNMPGMAGDKLSVELKKIRSDIPILLCTGFSETMTAEKAASIGITGFLMKPIEMRGLAQKIREVLDKTNEHGKTI